MHMKLSLDVSYLNRNEKKFVIVVHSVMLTCIVLGVELVTTKNITF